MATLQTELRDVRLALAAPSLAPAALLPPPPAAIETGIPRSVMALPLAWRDDEVVKAQMEQLHAHWKAIDDAARARLAELAAQQKAEAEAASAARANGQCPMEDEDDLITAIDEFKDAPDLHAALQKMVEDASASTACAAKRASFSSALDKLATAIKRPPVKRPRIDAAAVP